MGAVKINFNMRCIEIEFIYATGREADAINFNMRCIEIR